MSGTEAAAERPLLRVVRGEPSAEEIAALVAVLTSVGGPPADQPTSAQPLSVWARPDRLLRPPVHPTGWWASALPR